VKPSPVYAYDPPVAKRPPAHPIPLPYQLAQLAYELHTTVERHLHDTLKELDLTLALADLLWHLDPALGPLSRRALAERLRCDPSNVTFLVNRLEQHRLVSRAPVPGDRRVKALTLTPAGVQVRSRLIATIAESSMVAELTKPQQQQLADLLRRWIGDDHHSR
jgi:DNA-binding MarR family transcriptional regulator